MPPPRKQHCSVIIFDCMSENKVEQFKLLKKVCFLQWSQFQNDKIRILLLNTKGSDNKFEFENICLCNKSLDFSDPPFEIDDILDVTTSKGNWLEALYVGCNYIQDVYEGRGILTKQLVLLSDLKTEIDDETYLKSVIELIKENKIYFYALGPKVSKFPMVIKSVGDVQKCMSSLQFLEETSNIQYLKKIIKETNNSVVCGLSVGLHLFYSYRNPHEKQPWNEPLTICSSLKIPSNMVRMLHTDKISFSRRARYVIRKYVSADDSSVSYDRKDLIRCVKRCDRLIPIKSESMFYVDSFKEFVLYGFIDDNLMEHYLINDNSNGSYVVKPKTRLMKYLILEAKRLKKYGLARRVYAKNNVPKYYALIPCTDENVPYFIMTRLPYFQDIRQEFKEKDPKDVIKVEITDEVKNFLKQMEIENNFTLSPCMMMSEVLLKFANVYLSKEKKDVDYSTVDLPNSVECDVTIQKLLNSLPSFHRKKEKETDQ